MSNEKECPSWMVQLLPRLKENALRISPTPYVGLMGSPKHPILRKKFLMEYSKPV